MKRDWKQWTKAAVIRAIKTIAQTAIATVGVNWRVVGSTALLAGLLSVLTSVAGLPEIKE